MRTDKNKSMKSFLLDEMNFLVGSKYPVSDLRELYLLSRKPENSRIIQYVFLYALEIGELDKLMKLADDIPDPKREGLYIFSKDYKSAKEEYEPLLDMVEISDNAEDFLRKNYNNLNKRYYQIYDSFMHPIYKEKRIDNIDFNKT